jgi:nucleoside 2-deoxyribosyltransferase
VTIPEIPDARTTPRSVFLAGPFFQLVDPATGRMDATERQKIEKVLAHFEGRGWRVFNAHRREAWGTQFLPAAECTRLDFAEISQSELFIAFPGSPASPGTHVEIGWASALGKPIVLLLEHGRQYAFLVTGLAAVADVEFVDFDHIDDIFGQLDDAVDRVLARTASRFWPR